MSQIAVSKEVADWIAEHHVEQVRQVRALANEPEIRAWIDKILAENGIKTENLTLGQWSIILLNIPCDIYCWRIGGPGYYSEETGKCEECGHPKHRPSVWERLREDEAVTTK